MSRNPGHIFVAHVSKMSRFTHIFDVIYDLVGIIRNEVYFCGFYQCINYGESLTTLKSKSDLYSVCE